MKKLLVVLLTVVMILSLAAIASAEVSTWIGGDFYFRYNSGDKVFEQGNNNFFVGGITAKATKDNTWAKLFINTDTWQGTTVKDPEPGSATVFNDAIKYAVGIDKLAGLISLSFSTKDQDLCNIGQAPLMDSFDDFKTDPVFNTYEFGNSFGLVVDSDSFAIKAETVAIGNRTAPNLEDTRPNNFAIEGIFKFEGGKAYVAYKANSKNTWEAYGGDSLIDAGCEMKLGEMALKADVWIPSLNQSSLFTEVQGNVAMGAWDATLSVRLPQGGGDSIIGVGGNYKLDKITVGAKYMNTTDAQYEVYGLYNVGAFDLRAGYVDDGAGDGFFVLGVHAGIW